jgi:hypothetical protein
MPKFDDRNDAEKTILGALASGSTKDLVEQAEASGQDAMVQSSDLPIEMSPNDKKLISKKTGIIFKEEVNELFVRVELPEGWKIVPTEHSMWTRLVDDKGRRRGSIFYKASFYDRRAMLTFDPYYQIHTLSNEDYSQWLGVEVRDAEGKVLHSIKNEDPDDVHEYFEGQDKAREWLNENYPNNRDPFAYWDGGDN